MPEQTAIQQALIEQVTRYISQYTPQPRIISYKPNASGDVMGKFESQGRVFTFRLSGKGLVYKPLVQRKDNESDDDYALRFDTGSELWLEHFDAAKAYKPKPSITVKKERGTKDKPKCSAISYQCGVCISLGKNCIKNANTSVLKERLQKINSLSRMAAKGEAVPQVKTGVIGARVDPKSLMKKAQGQARELARGEKTSTNPKAKPTSVINNIEDKNEDKSFSFNEKLSWGENRKALRNHLERLGVSTGDESVAPDSYWKERVKKLERAAGLAKKDPKAVTQAEFDELIDTLPVKHPIVTGMRDWQRDTLKDPVKVKALKAKYGENAGLTEIYKKEVYSKDNPTKTPTQSTRDRQSAARAAAEPNKTTTLATPLPLTAQSQKRLERGESISDNETYHVKKEGNKFRVTDPNKFEDKGKLVDKAGLAAHMKELESKPSAVKKSSSMNPVIPINSNPDTMLRALRDGRLIGDAKQGYEIQQRGKDEYLVTTMPNKKGDYSGVMSRKELVDFVKGGGDASRFNKESKPEAGKREQLSEVEKKRLIQRAKDAPRHVEKIMKDHLDPDGVPLFGSDGVSILTKSAPPSAYDSQAVGISGRNGLTPTFLSPKTKELDNKFSSLYNRQKQAQGRNTPVFNDEMKKLEKEAQESFLKDYAVAKESGIVAARKRVDKPTDDKKLPPIPLTSGKNLTPSQKKQSRTADQVAIDRTKSDVSNATKRINTLDDSIKKLKAGKGVMSEADLKKVASLERQKAEWVEQRAKHQAKLEGLSGDNTKSQDKTLINTANAYQQKLKRFGDKAQQIESLQAVLKDKNSTTSQKEDAKLLLQKTIYDLDSLYSMKSTIKGSDIGWNAKQKYYISIPRKTDVSNLPLEKIQDLTTTTRYKIKAQEEVSIAPPKASPKIDRQEYKNINSALPETLDNDKKSLIARRIADLNHGQDVITDDSINRALSSVSIKDGKGKVVEALSKAGFKVEPPLNSMNPQDMIAALSRSGGDIQDKKDKIASYAQANGLKYSDLMKQFREKNSGASEVKPEPRLAQTDLFGNPVAIAEPTPAVTVKAKPKAKKESSKVDVFTPEMKSYAEKVLKGAEKGLPSIKDFGFENQEEVSLASSLDPQTYKYNRDLQDYTKRKQKELRKRLGDKFFVSPEESGRFLLNNLAQLNDSLKSVKPITIDLTQFGGGKYEVKPTPEAIKTFREVLAKAKTQTDANFKSSGGGLTKATEKEYQTALAKGEIDKATYDLLVGNSNKEFPDTVKLKHNMRSKDGTFATVNAKKIGGYAVHQKLSGVTDDEEAVTSPKEYTLTHLGSGMRLRTTEDFGDKKTPLKVKKARLEAFANELYKRIPSLDEKNVTAEQKQTIKELTEKAKRGDYDPRKDSADLYRVRIPNSILVSRQDADDCILTYVQDNSGNLMGVCQINGVKYRFLKPVIGATVLTPLAETGLGYLFDMAPDLTLTQSTGDPFDGIFNPFKKALASL